MGPEARVPVGPSPGCCLCVCVYVAPSLPSLLCLSRSRVSLSNSRPPSQPLSVSPYFSFLLFLPSSLLPCVPPPRCAPFFASLPLPHLSPLPSLCVLPFLALPVCRSLSPPAARRRPSAPARFAAVSWRTDNLAAAAAPAPPPPPSDPGPGPTRGGGARAPCAGVRGSGGMPAQN